MGVAVVLAPEAAVEQGARALWAVEHDHMPWRGWAEADQGEWLQRSRIVLEAALAAAPDACIRAEVRGPAGS